VIASVEGPMAPMNDPPETRYVRNGAVQLAYQVLGEGPNLAVISSGPGSHVDFMWNEPSAARWLRRLASFSRLVIYDNRAARAQGRAWPVGDLRGRQLRKPSA
jgi:pimeloyl-ACP methyl ester carboxylesterase